jgi:hypothetical protein
VRSSHTEFLPYIHAHTSFVWAATTLTTSRLIINSRRENGRAAQLWEGQMEDVDVDTSEHEHLDERQSTKSFWV